MYAPIIALLGPTAVGKSYQALRLCEAFGAAILSADSRQVYRYMDIGTAKPSAAERAQIPHFMIDVVEPSETYSAQRFAVEGQRVLTAAGRRKQPMFVVGGTGFYVSVLLDRPAIPQVPPDHALRTRLRAEAQSVGSPALHARLRGLDPASAERIHPNNLARVLRALEIVETTGKRVPVAVSHHRVPALYLGLRMDRAELHSVADLRVDQQVARGLIDEVESLLAMGYSPSAASLDGLGYRQFSAYIRGDLDREDAIARYKIATHQYIRRQLTWFRRDQRIEWFDLQDSTDAALMERVRRYLATAL